MTEQEKQHSCLLYNPGDPEILKNQNGYLDDLAEYNAISHTQPQRRWEKLHEMFAEFGEGSYVESPFQSNFGGRNVHFGRAVYANFNLTLVDDTHIYVGDNTMIGPNVTIVTAAHPIDPELRRQGLQYNLPVHIGKNCWLGAGVTILPGVTIGDDTVIGAGSVVTKDIPSGVVAVGIPCHVLRQVGEHDRKFYDHYRPVDPGAGQP